MRDVFVGKPKSRILKYVGLAIIFLPVALVVIIILGFLVTRSPRVMPYILMGLFGLALILVLRRMQSRALHRLQELFNAPSVVEPPGVFMHLFEVSHRLVHPKAMTLTAEHLAKHGAAGTAFRVWWNLPPEKIEPLCVPFEPRLLNESDEAFGHLAEGTTERDNGHAVAKNSILPAGVRRNILLKGGFLWLISSFFVLSFAILESIELRRPTFLLMGWCLLLAATLFLPATGGVFFGDQWLLVPDGVVLRKSRIRSRKDDKLHVFAARRSVIVVRQLGQKTWLLAVADDSTCGLTNLTANELNLLLRAWLSPLSPPPVERMGDFV